MAKRIRTLTGVLLVAGRMENFGGGPMGFTVDGLRAIAQQFNEREKAEGFKGAALSVEDDKLICSVPFPPDGWEGLKEISLLAES